MCAIRHEGEDGKEFPKNRERKRIRKRKKNN
jgi:hypothetical protein